MRTGFVVLAMLVLTSSGCLELTVDGQDAGDGVADVLDSGSDSLGDDAVGPGDLAAVDAAADVNGGGDDAAVDAGPDVNGGGERFPACEPGAVSQTVTFVHVNDLHSSYMMNGEGGESSWARIAGYVKQVRAANPFTVFTNGGDDHEKGSIAEQLSGGMATVEAVRAMKFDVRVIGNHDFAWGPEALLQHSRDEHSVVLCSNTEYQGLESAAWGAARYAEMQVGCVRVGFFGLHPHPYDHNNESYEGAYFKDNQDFATRYDYEAVVREIVAAHRDDVDLLVMVSHLGAGPDRDIAAAVGGIDLILGGHSHTFLGEADVVGGTPIVQCGADGMFIGRVDVDFDVSGGLVRGIDYRTELNLQGAIEADRDTQDAIAGIFRKYAPSAEASAAMVQGGARSVDEVAARAAIDVARADVALIREETIWTSWSPGGLSIQKMLDIFKVERQPAGTPGFNSLYRVQVDGAVLADLVAALPEGFTYAGPDVIENGRTYRLAIQKGPAHEPERYFGAGVTFGVPEAVAEMWYVLYRYGAERYLNCVYIDSDETIPGCGWPE